MLPCTWLRCLAKLAHYTSQASTGYTWYEMTFFTRWEPGLCVDTLDNLPTDLKRALLTEPGVLDEVVWCGVEARSHMVKIE